jgi:CMP-N-acetylneuraminic acid synthetase
MPAERSIDIDNLWDFYLAELVLNDKKYNKEAKA